MQLITAALVVLAYTTPNALGQLTLATNATQHQLSRNNTSIIQATSLIKEHVATTSTDNGACTSYSVSPNDTCDSIARAHGLTAADIQAYNLNTWRFAGCDFLQPGMLICLDLGAAPMPATDPNAVCGPWVKGTEPPDDINADLAQLNPCVLNACCNNWGQCGITPEFCSVKDSPFLGPGAAPPGSTSCISNCGTDIVSGQPVSDPFTIGYFDASSIDRPCLTIEPTQIPPGKLTHLHFGFVEISASGQLQPFGAQASLWDKFKSITGPKRIISIGGWAFSNANDTHNIFSRVVSPGIVRDTFITSLVRFISNEGIDGVDFDWEYPSLIAAAGDRSDGENFVEFISLLRTAFDAIGSKSISIAVPANYWSLKAFPIKELSEHLDYIVFMTYDLHGQWDYGNQYAISGCPSGNCLRSHVNLTETDFALAMITKAGVPASKIVVGVSSYGRSFEMTQPGCTDPTCTFSGPDSGARPGKCTQTAGILANAEIQSILASDSTAMTWYDTSSNSDVIVYNETQWVSFMSEMTKESRRGFYLSLGFLGTADWAIDMAQPHDVPEISDYPWCDQADKYNTIDDIAHDGSIPSSCVNVYIVAVMAKELHAALDSYSAIMGDEYHEKYEAFARHVRKQAPAALKTFYAGDDVDEYFTCEYQVMKRKPPFHNETKTCSTKHYPHKYMTGDIRIYYTVKDEPLFCSEISDKYGLDCDWLDYEWQREAQCCFQGYCNCNRYRNQPALKPDFKIFDPASQIQSSLTSYRELADWLEEVSVLEPAGLFTGSVADFIDAASMTVYSAQAAVKSMQQVADAGEKAEKEEEKQRKQMILMFVTAFLFVLPGVGWLAEAAELAAIGRIIALAAEAGNVAVSLYEVVDDPKSAPMAIASMLFGGVATRDIAALGRAAQASRLMERDILKSLGGDVLANVEKVQSVRQLCRL